MLLEAVREVQVEHHLAVLERLSGLLQRIIEVVKIVHAVEESQLLLAHLVGDVVQHHRGLLPGVVLVPGGGPKTLGLQLLVGQQVLGDAQRLLGHASVGHQGAVGRQHAGQVCGNLATHAVQGELDGRHFLDHFVELGGVKVVLVSVDVAAEVGQQLQCAVQVRSAPRKRPA